MQGVDSLTSTWSLPFDPRGVVLTHYIVLAKVCPEKIFQVNQNWQNQNIYFIQEQLIIFKCNHNFKEEGQDL